jgi:hypothetical protein
MRKMVRFGTDQVIACREKARRWNNYRKKFDGGAGGSSWADSINLAASWHLQNLKAIES